MLRILSVAFAGTEASLFPAGGKWSHSRHFAPQREVVAVADEWFGAIAPHFKDTSPNVSALKSDRTVRPTILLFG